MPGLHAARTIAERLVALEFPEMASQLADVITEEDIGSRILAASDFSANLSAFITGAGWAIAFSQNRAGTKAERTLAELAYIHYKLQDIQWWDEAKPENTRRAENCCACR